MTCHRSDACDPSDSGSSGRADLRSSRILPKRTRPKSTPPRFAAAIDHGVAYLKAPATAPTALGPNYTGYDGGVIASAPGAVQLRRAVGRSRDAARHWNISAA